MQPGKRLIGKVAIVTGGASGIGAETARVFAAHGATVLVSDSNTALGKAVTQEIVANGGTASFHALDVCEERQWATVVAETERNFGRLDILCNIAGISGRDPQMNIQTTHTAGPRLAEQTLEHWSKVMEVNSTSVFLGTKAVIAPMQRAGGGSIINISSICGIIGSHANAAYHASKGAVRIFSKAAAIQYAADKIRVNSVHPGFVDTPYRLVRRQARRDLHRLEPQHPRARDVPECDDHARWYRHARQWLWLPQAREAANLGRSRQGLATLHRDLHRGIRTARAMFESNFPVDKHSGSYAVYWNAFKRLASGASAAEKALLFRETARKFYNLP